MSFNNKKHWEEIYTQKKPTEVSWYQIEPTVSLELFKSLEINPTEKLSMLAGEHLCLLINC